MTQKILFVIHSLSRGGAQKMVYNIASFFAQRGHNVTIITISNAKVAYPLENNIKHKYLYQSTTKKYSIFNNISLLRSYIKHEQFKTVISFICKINMVTILACLRLKLSLHVSVRNDPRYNMSILGNFIRNILYFIPNSIIFQNKQELEYFPKGIRKKGIIIYNPIEDNLPIKKKNKATHRIIMAGSINEQKNYQLAIKGFAIFNKLCPLYTLHIYGKGNKEKIVQLVDEYNLITNVFIHPLTRNIYQRMYESDIYLSTSVYEGISNSILEAMGIGLPVVITECSREIIRPGYNGLVISENKPEAVANALGEIVNNRNFWKNAIEYSKKLKKELTLEIIGEKWYKLL